jgi:hypothetical protein
MVIRRLGLGDEESMGLMGSLPVGMSSGAISTQRAKSPKTVPTDRADNDEYIPSASLVTARCNCSSPKASQEQELFSISREDLDHCARNVRALMKLVEDAQSVHDSTGECEIAANTYKGYLTALHNIVPMQPKRTSRLRQYFSKPLAKLYRSKELSAATTKDNCLSTIAQSRPVLSGTPLKTSTTLPPR